MKINIQTTFWHRNDEKTNYLIGKFLLFFYFILITNILIGIFANNKTLITIQLFAIATLFIISLSKNKYDKEISAQEKQIENNKKTN